MFKRKFYDEMLEWKNRDQGASALLIEGARRVGKSTIAEAFAKREYDSYLAIDFSEAPQEVLDLFRQYRQDLETFFTYLSAYYEVNLVPRHSVIIFDEVQSFLLRANSLNDWWLMAVSITLKLGRCCPSIRMSKILLFLPRSSQGS